MWPSRSLISILMAFLAVAAAENNVTHASPWLKRARKPRHGGCRFQPWICLERYPPFRPRLCCKNRCVDVDSDENNCGFCGIRCPFTWRCCGGICIDTGVNPFHCGWCFKKCPFEVLCFYGMCGYAQPPFPFPFQPKKHRPLPPEIPRTRPPPPEGFAP